jgi:hypothetical protein
MKKMIRKVVTHVPTGVAWQTRGFPLTETREHEYDNWLMRVMSGEATCFTLDTGLNDNHSRLTLFNAELLKRCVIEVEVYEERDE